MQNEMEKLIEELNYHTKLYDEGHPVISDKEWDDMYFRLQELEKTEKPLPNSPTQWVYFSPSLSKLNKVTHNHYMLSLDKSKNLVDIDAFVKGHTWIAMSKLDGLTCSLMYSDGVLVSAETRGNGVVGEDILNNILVNPTVPNRINHKGTLIVDGEVICTYKDFEAFKDDYKNPRNFAAGSIRLLDPRESKDRHLTFVAWDVIEGGMFDRLSDNLSELRVYGFLTVPFFTNDNSTVLDSVENIKGESQKLSYPIDGVVFKYNLIEEYAAAGKTEHHFKGGLALKFYDEEYETRLLDIEWSLGRTGVITPVAIFEPVEIDNTEISRASLHNISVMLETLGQPYKNEPIRIFRSNMIIPQISWGDKKDLTISDFTCNCCPVCGEPTRLKNNNGILTLYCDNPKCEGKLVNHLDHFCGKQGLDIKGLSKATLSKLIDWDWVSNIEDIFLLSQHWHEWIEKDGFGEKSVEKVLSAIEDSCRTELWRIIAAAGIPQIGTGTAKALANHFKTWEAFREAIDTRYDFSELPDIGEITRDCILDFDYSEIDKVIPLFTYGQPVVAETKESSISGKVFVVTGKVHHFKNREELKEKIESLGGKVSGSVTGKTDYLINNDKDSTTAKNKTAKEKGIPIISEEDFLDMINA